METRSRDKNRISKNSKQDHIPQSDGEKAIEELAIGNLTTQMINGILYIVVLRGNQKWYFQGKTSVQAFTSSSGDDRYTTPGSLTVNDGGTPVGTVAGVQTLLDGTVYQLPEVAGVPGYDVEFNFTGISGFKGIATRIHYNGSSSHDVTFDVYNYTTTSWDQIYLLSSSTNFNYRYIELKDGSNYYDSSGNAIVRCYHNTSGNSSHDLYVDYIAIIS